MGHNWANYSNERQLSYFRHHKPSKTPQSTLRVISRSFHQKTAHDPPCCTWQFKIWAPTPRGGSWAFPPEPHRILTHWTLCFTGFLHPWTTKTVTITWISRHLNCNSQVSLLDPWVVISFYSYSFFLYFFFQLLKIHCKRDKKIPVNAVKVPLYVWISWSCLNLFKIC